MRTYEVEFKSTTYRTYTVDAPNKKFAEEYALPKLLDDETVSNAWIENAEVDSIREEGEELEELRAGLDEELYNNLPRKD